MVVFSENTVGPGHKDAPRTLALGSWSLCIDPRCATAADHRVGRARDEIREQVAAAARRARDGVVAAAAAFFGVAGGPAAPGPSSSSSSSSDDGA